MSQPDVRAQLRAAHAGPWFHLRTSPWIPVLTTAGDRCEVSLEQLLSDAHQITDLAESNPLTRAALRRYLTALAADIVRSGGGDCVTWEDRLDAQTGFTSAEVTALLDRESDHLWLYHPETPFLQDARLIAALRNPERALASHAELVAHLPGGSEAAWFWKTTDPAARTGLSAAAAARALLTRWYYTLNGNSSIVATPTKDQKSQADSAFSEGPATLTHAFRVAGSLFATLLRNLTDELVARPQQGPFTGPAWRDPDRPRLSEDPLYRYTLTATSVLLGPRDAHDRIGCVVRGPVPVDDTIVKAVRDTARDGDPHRILVSENNRSAKTKVLRLPVDDHPLHHLNALRRAGLVQAASPHGVIAESRLFLSGAPGRHSETIELLVAAKHGSATSPKWSQTLTVALPAAVLDDSVSGLGGILEACFDPRGGVESRLRWAVRDALGRRGPDGKVTPARVTDGPVQRCLEHSTRAWLDAAQNTVARLRHHRGVTPAVEDDAVTEVYTAAQHAFTNALAPYAGTVRYAATTITAHRRLRRPE